MPSLHALDALIVSVVMATIVRSRWAKVLWLPGPPWVWFSVMATGNHFWLDIAAGILVPIVAGAIVYRPWRRLRPAAMSLKAAYTAGTRGIAARSMTGLARTRVTPNMLTAAGVSLCAIGAVLVYFEYRTEWFFFCGGWPSSSALCSTSSTARWRGRAGSRRRSAASSTRPPTGSAKG